MKMKKNIFIIILFCAFLAGIVPYIKVEVLTLQHKAEFRTLYNSNGMIKDVEYLKVMDYSKESANVYYVTSGKKAGFLYKFIRRNEEGWQLEGWDVVWSSSGSADNFIWPYYR